MMKQIICCTLVALCGLASSVNVHAQVLSDFYHYELNDNGTYSVWVNTDFRQELNKPSGGEFKSGDYTWTTGMPLPNPAPNGMYNGRKVTSMASMFYKCDEMTSVDLSLFCTDNVDDMYYMFQECFSLTSLDLSSFKTDNVTDMRGMFDECASLTTLDLSGFNTANVTNMKNMFFYCRNLASVNLSSFNTANVTDMSWMFGSCYALQNLDLSNFNTTEATQMDYMFSKCGDLVRLNLSSFSFEQTPSKVSMFDMCGINTSQTTVVAHDEAAISWLKNGTEVDLERFKFVTPETDGIQPVISSSAVDGKTFTLDGRQIGQQTLPAGIYIVGRKKVVVR